MSWFESYSSRFSATTDFRTPLLVFDNQYGLYLPDIFFWIELVISFFLQGAVAALVGLVIYHLIVRRQGSPSAYLLGYGLLIPAWILLPRRILDSFGVQNKIFRFCAGSITPTLSIFRTSQALHGFANATDSAPAFMLYYGWPLRPNRDKSDNFIPASMSYIVGQLVRFAAYVLLLGLYCSLFFLLDFFPTLGTQTTERVISWYSLEAVLDPTRWKDSFLYALLFQLYLATYGKGLCLITSVLTQSEVSPMMENPMMLSQSPSEFWGRRWNLVVHQALKDGVYKPIRSCGGSPALAVFGAFIGSALFHEHLLTMVFDDFPNSHGSNTAFFLWNAVLVILEVVVGGTAPFAWASEILPHPIKTFMIVMMGLPVAHWFYETYVSTDFFAQGNVGLFSILPLEDTALR